MADVMGEAEDRLGGARYAALERSDEFLEELRRLKRDEQTYRDFFENAVEGMFQSKRDGGYIRVNPALASILGFDSPEEMTGSLTDLRNQLYVEPRDRDRLFTLMRKSGWVKDFETRFRRKDGDVRDIAVTAREVRDENGGLLYIEGFNLDITERKRAEERLAETQARYRAIVEDQNELVCRFEADNTITFVNESFAAYFGKTKEELVGSKFVPEIPDEDKPAIRKFLKRLTPGHPAAGLEHRIVMADGSIRWHQRSDRAFFDEHGRLTEYQTVGRDITSRVEAERNLQRIMEEKERYRLNLDAVFRSIPEAIITVDTSMRILQTNKALEEICCIGKSLAPGKMALDLSGSCKRSCFHVLSKTLQTREPVVEYRVECKGATPGRAVIINSSPLLDADNQFLGAVLVIRDITRLADLEKRLTDLHSYKSIIGKSKVMRDVYSVLDLLSDLESTVLVTGESGTGKELIAEALHFGGVRAPGPLVKVNCSALSENLLESELFGHVRGAFTGAIRDKVGRFEAAEGGTIFLDEIGDISPRIQLNLLRVLERKEFERVGESKTRRANVRVIAATNVDLLEKINQGLFREDLYYRMKVMVIHLPPLRERPEDIPLLTEHFISQFRAGFGKKITKPSEEVMKIFMTYPWPGNVRELRYALERACILCPGGQIDVEQLPPELTRTELAKSEPRARYVARPAEKSAPRGLTRQDIDEALLQASNNRAKAARLLGVDRRTLYRNMERHGIS